MANKSIEKELIESQKILWGKVIKCFFIDDNTPAMVVDLKETELGKEGIVRMADADGELERKSLISLMNKVVPVIVTEVDGDKVYCSRKAAQEYLRSTIKEGSNYEGEVVSAMDHGVYIEVQGCTGLLRNGDYISQAVPAKSYLHAGDKIAVTPQFTPSGRLNWLPVKKPSHKDFKYTVEANTVVLGTVINTATDPSGSIAVYVHLEEGLDARCFLPPNMEISKKDQVAVRIDHITFPENEMPRVRASILRNFGPQS